MPRSVLCVCDEGYNPFGANENGDIRHTTHKIYERKGIRLMAQFYSTSSAVAAASNFHHDETSRRLKSLVVIYLEFSSKRYIPLMSSTPPQCAISCFSVRTSGCLHVQPESARWSVFLRHLILSGFRQTSNISCV